MVVNGFLPISEFPLQDGVSVTPNGATAEAANPQAGDFSALLFLILGNPQTPEASVGGRSGSISIAVSAEGRTDDHSTVTPGTDSSGPDHPVGNLATKFVDIKPADAVLANTEAQTRTAGAPVVNDAFAQPGPAMQAQIQSDAHKAEALPPEGKTGEPHNNNNGAFIAADLARLPVPAAQAGVLEDAYASESTVAVTAVAEQANVRMEPFADGGVASVETARPASPSELPPHLGGRPMKLAPANERANESRISIAEGEKAMQVRGDKMASHASYVVAQGFAAKSQHGAGPAVAKIAGEPVSLGEGGLKIGGESRAPGDGDSHGGVVSAAIHRSGETMSANSHRGDQDNFFQQRYSEAGQQPVRASFEVLWRDGAPIHSNHVVESGPQATTRGSDWRPLIDHVAGEINGHIRIGKSEAVVQLDPPELGRLQIDLRLDGDRLEARILAENHESGNLIETHLPELRLALAESRVEHVEVRVDNGSWSEARGDTQQGQRQESGDGRQRPHDNGSAPRNDSEKHDPAWQQPTVRESGRLSMWA